MGYFGGGGLGLADCVRGFTGQVHLAGTPGQSSARKGARSWAGSSWDLESVFWLISYQDNISTRDRKLFVLTAISR